MPGFGTHSRAIALSAVLLACSAEGDDIGDSRAGTGRRPDAGFVSRPALAGSGAGGISSNNWNPGGPMALAGSNSTPPPPNAAGSCAAISQQAENQRQPADVILAVDNSSSMNDEIAFVRNQLNAFSQQIVASGVDVRIVLISAPRNGSTDPENTSDDGAGNGICIAPPLGSGTCPADSRAPSYFHVPQRISSHSALDRFIKYFPMYQAQLRANATKTFVVVTDDDAQDDAATFTQSVAGLPGGLFSSWSFAGIYCFMDCPDAAAIGKVYNDLVTQTKGVAGDLCLQDFAPVFDRLAKAVISNSGLACEWNIPAPSAGQSFHREQVNVQYTKQGAAPQPVLQVSGAAACGVRSGWYYDDEQNPKRILVCPATCGELQNDLSARIDVLFGCDTQVAPE